MPPPHQTMSAFSLPPPSRSRTRRRPAMCSLDPQTNTSQTQATNSSSTPTTSHYSLTENGEDVSQVSRLRLLKLSLLLSDLHFRVNTHHIHPALHLPLFSISALSTSLLATPPPPQSTVREALWSLREALEPFPVSPFTRESLELARACALHVPTTQATDRLQELRTLSVETRLLQELKGLRGMVVEFLSTVPTECDKSNVLCMAAELGIDEYRVRGKTRLSDAVLELTNCKQDIPVHVKEAAGRVRTVLQDSLAEDLQSSPAGEAMLLRPRVVDIPNFAVVNDKFLRGGQPNRGGLDWLRQYGVSVIVDLRGSDRGNMWIPHCRLLPGTGNDEKVQFCNIPIEDFCTPTFAQVNEFSALVERVCGDNGVIFVHCKAGIGRTGTLIACWRVSKGMDVEEALGMERLYSEGGGGLRQEAFVREFARRWKERQS